MSRVHASVEVLKNGTLKVRDMKAPNGTLVNGTRVPVNGEVIAMLSSDTVIRFALNPCTYKVTESVPEVPSMSSPMEAQLAVGQRGPEVTEILEAKPRGGGRHRPSAGFVGAATGSSPDGTTGRAGNAASAATPPSSDSGSGRRAGSRWGVTAHTYATAGDTSGSEIPDHPSGSSSSVGEGGVGGGNAGGTALGLGGAVEARPVPAVPFVKSHESFEEEGLEVEHERHHSTVHVVEAPTRKSDDAAAGGCAGGDASNELTVEERKEMCRKAAAEIQAAACERKRKISDAVAAAASAAAAASGGGVGHQQHSLQPPPTHPPAGSSGHEYEHSFMSNAAKHRKFLKLLGHDHTAGGATAAAASSSSLVDSLKSAAEHSESAASASSPPLHVGSSASPSTAGRLAAGGEGGQRAGAGAATGIGSGAATPTVSELAEDIAKEKESKQEEQRLKMILERQFAEGMRRTGGRKTGLGL
eukprot:GHVU01225254.1.p1 GENE.GHVU01225254.1~~GHVU01225254.1.p1  ORF type:complete len:472 (-),score=99.66 GHVU01225254.1:263-1678(-)